MLHHLKVSWQEYAIRNKPSFIPLTRVGLGVDDEQQHDVNTLCGFQHGEHSMSAGESAECGVCACSPWARR